MATLPVSVTTMLATRRRIVRRPVMALAVVVLLLNLYVSAWCGTYWLKGRGVITHDRRSRLEVTVFYPIWRYMRNDWPGYRSLYVMAYWCEYQGAGTPQSLEQTKNLLFPDDDDP